jgi:hypothetical protein
MPTPASDIFRQLAYKVEATYGTAPSASGAQLLRRVGSTIDLDKDTYESQEVRTDYQVADYRHGVRRVTGQITGELSAGTYKDFMAALLKRAFATVTALTGLTLTIAGSGPTYTITRGSGDWIAGGAKVYDVVRLTAGSFNAANLNKNLLIVGLTTTVMTVVVINASALVAEGPIASATVTWPGKKTFIPQTGHTDLSFSIEHFYSDMSPVQSEVFTGCKIAKIDLALPPTGMATIAMDVTGQNVTTATAQYFTSPTALTGTGVMAAVNGVARVAGAAAASLTGLTLTVEGSFSGQPVVGSNVIPNQAPGAVRVTGQATAFFDSVTLRDAFLNESEIDLAGVFTADNTAASDFIVLALPRIKLGGAKKAPADGGLVMTIPFQGLLNVNGGSAVNTEKTTISVQDSQA